MRDERPILWCPQPPIGCGQEVMVYNRQGDYWECPRCGSQYWRDGARLERVEKAEDLQTWEERMERIKRHLTRWALNKPAPDPLPYGYVNSRSGKGRSHNTSGKRRKKPRKRLRQRTPEPFDVCKVRRGKP